MAQIKLNATYGMTGTLPAVSGANLTSLTSGNLTGALPAISGASLTTLNATNVSSGTLNAARYSGGKILQVQSQNYQTETGTNSSTYGDTGLTINITPSATSSKILVMVAMGEGYTTSGTESCFKLLRDSTLLSEFIVNLGLVASGGRAVIINMSSFPYFLAFFKASGNKKPVSPSTISLNSTKSNSPPFPNISLPSIANSCTPYSIALSSKSYLLSLAIFKLSKLALIYI